MTPECRQAVSGSGKNTFDSSLKDVTYYGYWFRDNVSVDITGADSASGIASVEYQAVSAEESYDANGTWVTWNAEDKLSLTESGRYVVYAVLQTMQETRRSSILMG